MLSSRVLLHLWFDGDPLEFGERVHHDHRQTLRDAQSAMTDWFKWLQGNASFWP